MHQDPTSHMKMLRSQKSILCLIVVFAGFQALAPAQRCTSCCALAYAADSTTVSSDAELRAALAKLGEQKVKDSSDKTIKIAPGVYRGGYSVAGIDGVTIEALDPKSPPEFRGGNLAWHFSKCSKLTLRNLTVTGQSDNGINIDDGGQLDKPVTDLLLEGLYISQIGPEGNHDGMKLSGIDRFEIRDCSIEGWAGQGIDMVGCHKGLIENCKFQGKEGFTATAGIQTKGGSADIQIEECRFVDAGERPVNIGGSTGLPYFRPLDAKHEAANIRVMNCRFEGSPCAAAFVGVDGARFQNNTILYPTKWIFRVLQETTGPRFTACRNILIADNCIVFRRSEVTVQCNIGSGTQPETMTFKGNHWLAEDRPEASKPRLPVTEQDAHYGVDCRSAHKEK